MSISSNVAIIGHEAYGGGTGTWSTASSLAAGYPVTNLDDANLFHRVRAAGTTLALDLDLASARSLDSFVLCGTNASLSATIRVELGTSAGTHDVYDSGTVSAFDTSLATLAAYTPPWGRSVVALKTNGAASARYVRLTLADGSNADGYVEVALARVGAAWQPGADFDETWKANDKLVGDPGNEKVLRGHQLRWKNLIAGERSQLASLLRTLLSVGRVYVLPCPLAPETWLEQGIWSMFEKPYEAMPLQGIGAKSGARSKWTLELNPREVDE